MAVNKVVYGTTVLVDLTGDTVTANNLLTGTTAHGADGNAITGALVINTVYTGSGDPSDSLGFDGDIYLDLG